MAPAVLLIHPSEFQLQRRLAWCPFYSTSYLMPEAWDRCRVRGGEDYLDVFRDVCKDIRHKSSLLLRISL